jgi:hypothetical protein
MQLFEMARSGNTDFGFYSTADKNEINQGISCLMAFVMRIYAALKRVTF